MKKLNYKTIKVNGSEYKALSLKDKLVIAEQRVASFAIALDEYYNKNILTEEDHYNNPRLNKLNDKREDLQREVDNLKERILFA